MPSGSDLPTHPTISEIQALPFGDGSINFKEIDVTGATELPPYKMTNDRVLAATCHAAFQDSILEQGSDQRWFVFPSVQRSLYEQLRLLGQQQRDHGGISFLTHVIEVTNRVFNCPALNHYDREHIAFAAINHDIEDLCKDLGLQPQFIRKHFLGFLKRPAAFNNEVERSLYLLMDPPSILGKKRKELQIDRIQDMSPVEIHIRFFDKFCTYKRDLYNMEMINPQTGKPFLYIKTQKEAAALRQKIADKNDVVLALPVAQEYKDAWDSLCRQINRKIDQQLSRAATHDKFARAQASLSRRCHDLSRTVWQITTRSSRRAWAFLSTRAL